MTSSGFQRLFKVSVCLVEFFLGFFWSWSHDSLKSTLYAGIRLAFCTLYSGMGYLVESGSDLHTTHTRAHAMSRKMKPEECLQRSESET